MKWTRVASACLAGAAIAGAGVTSAQAWVWATPKSQIWMNGGHGYGSTSPNGLYGASISAQLADTQTGDGRIYANSWGYGHGSVSVQTARRADGGSSLMVQSGGGRDLWGGSTGTVYQFTNWETGLCRDISWAADKCSDDYRRTGHLS